MKIYAYCWATGLIEFGDTVPDGAIGIAYGARAAVDRLMGATARLAHDNKSLLVPGVPEASDEDAKGDALGVWLKWLNSRQHRGVQLFVECANV
ncbi:host nuclease inhibitor protein [Burkholderia cenocepacia]|uniref:host nuclease inhibitor protein n=1 Tax=Burkholderia cenocepacia TaxID=95486 RepID=UPI00158BA349|nr:host nuclease inhibitor protein [Burkholderia cenocepacia]